MTNIIEQGIKQKVRFSSNRHSNLTIEDLYDLESEDMKSVAGILDQQRKDAGADSILPGESDSSALKLIDLKLKIVIHIWNSRQKEAEAKVSDMIKRQKIEELDKEIEAARKKSRKELTLEDLEAERAELLNS